MKRNLIVLTALLLIGGKIFSQRKSMKDSIYHAVIVGLQFEGQKPDKDMAVRFGPSIAVGIPVLYKTSKNLLFGVEGNYFFGTHVREAVMTNLFTPEMTITDANGNPGTVRINERGFTAYAMLGGIINKLGHNKNSGLMFLGGAGYMQHKININDVGRSLPQIHGNLVKGYDRLTGGFACNQFIGYMFISQNKIANFYFGIEIQEGFTKGLRGYQYDLMAKDDKSRFDMLYGIRFGWLLPIYQKAPKEFYYY